MKTADFLVNTSAVMAVAGLISFLGYMAVMTPIVIMHYPSGNCITVDSPRSEHNCENLPNRFYTEWRP